MREGDLTSVYWSKCQFALSNAMRMALKKLYRQARLPRQKSKWQIWLVECPAWHSTMQIATTEIKMADLLVLVRSCAGCLCLFLLDS
jgi:hypothetical protein